VLGFKGDVNAAKRAISPEQFYAWRVYYRYEPFGDEVRQLALIAMLLFNANRGPDVEPRSIEDFLPVRPPKPPRRRVDWREIKEKLAASAAMWEAAEQGQRQERK